MNPTDFVRRKVKHANLHIQVFELYEDVLAGKVSGTTPIQSPMLPFGVAP